jgi:putative MFS transporter
MTDDHYQIAARLERLPVSRWHLRMRYIVGTGLFFDAFDILTIGYAIPTLISLWGLTTPQIGLLISIGSVGQMLGALFFGWLAEKVGRIPAMVTTIMVYSIMSLCCAFAWDLQSLLILRFIQGLGLGGESPVTNTYISEFAKA